MTKPKKHKQRFEHEWCGYVEEENLTSTMREESKDGWELVDVILLPISRPSFPVYNLFFKRPV